MINEPNIGMCFEEARIFLKVSEQLENDEETLFGGIFPYVVNSALACELFLKTIIMINSTPRQIVREHELTTLFNSLPTEDQTNIKELFSRRMKHDFDSLIEEMSSTFVKWRYAYEQETIKINITGILTLAQVLNDYITEIYVDKGE